MSFRNRNCYFRPDSNASVIVRVDGPAQQHPDDDRDGHPFGDTRTDRHIRETDGGGRCRLRRPTTPYPTSEGIVYSSCNRQDHRHTYRANAYLRTLVVPVMSKANTYNVVRPKATRCWTLMVTVIAFLEGGGFKRKTGLENVRTL